MQKITGFLKANYIPLAISAVIYSFYLYSTIAGNRICDCESTEKYNQNQSQNRGGRVIGINRFNHK